MLHIAAARERFEDRVILDIGFVRGYGNVADAVTKCTQQKSLQRVPFTGTLEVRAEQ